MRQAISLLAMVSLVLLGGVAMSWTKSAHVPIGEVPVEVSETTEVADAMLADGAQTTRGDEDYDRPLATRTSALFGASPLTRPPR